MFFLYNYLIISYSYYLSYSPSSNMGNSYFNPRQLPAVIFHPHLIKSLQKDEQINSFIKQKIHNLKILKKQNPHLPPSLYDQICDFNIGGDKLSLKNIETLFKSIKQVKFTEINLIIKAQDEVSKKIKARQDMYDKQVNIMKCLNYPQSINLKILSLQHCNIKSIQSLSCINMSKLTKLQIINNPICTYKVLSKCNFRDLKTLKLFHNYESQTGYLNYLTRCNLSNNMVQINIDTVYLRQQSAIFNASQIPRQWIDMRPILKLKCQYFQQLSFRQGTDLFDYSIQQQQKVYEYRVQQMIKKKYKYVSMSICIE